MVDAKMNGYLPYAPNKDSIFHANHGYPRHYRPPHRMPPHQSLQRGYPRMNNYSPRSFSYPQRVHPNNMSYSRQPVYHSKSHHQKYLTDFESKSQTLTGDCTRTSVSSYRYGNTKDINMVMEPIKHGIAQTSAEELQTSTVQPLITQSRMRPSSMSQPCQTQISVAQTGFEQHSMVRPRSLHFSTAQTEIPKVQPRIAKNSIERQPRVLQSLGEQFSQSQMSMLESFPSTARSSVPIMTHTSMYQQNMTETSVVQPQILITSPRTEGSVTSSVRQRNMSEPSATQPSISYDRIEEVTTRKSLTTPARQDHTMFPSPQRSPTYPGIAKTSAISSTSQMPTRRPSLQKTSITLSRMEQTSVSPPQTSMPIVHSSSGTAKMSLSDPRVEKTSQAAPTVTQPTSMVKTSMVQHIKQRSSQSNQMTGKSSDGSEKQSFLVQYPVSTLYNKQWKTNCSATTVNANFSKKGTNVSTHSNSDVQRYQPYPKVVTHGEVNVENPFCTKATGGNSGVKFENIRKNRWDLKEQGAGKSLQQESVNFKNASKSDYTIGVNFEGTNQSGYNNNNTESYLETKNNLISQFEITHCKTGENKTIVKSKLCGQSGYSNKDMCFLGKKSSNNELGNNKTSSYLDKMEMSNNFDSNEKNENSSSINDDNFDDGASSDTDIRNMDHNDEFDNKDAAELLMSMSNRSIKISRLMEEQKRLMASLHGVKSTSKV